jgi:hypothetical protein
MENKVETSAETNIQSLYFVSLDEKQPCSSSNLQKSQKGTTHQRYYSGFQMRSRHNPSPYTLENSLEVFS